MSKSQRLSREIVSDLLEKAIGNTPKSSFSLKEHETNEIEILENGLEEEEVQKEPADGEEEKKKAEDTDKNVARKQDEEKGMARGENVLEEDQPDFVRSEKNNSVNGSSLAGKEVDSNDVLPVEPSPLTSNASSISTIKGNSAEQNAVKSDQNLLKSTTTMTESPLTLSSSSVSSYQSEKKNDSVGEMLQYNTPIIEKSGSLRSIKRSMSAMKSIDEDAVLEADISVSRSFSSPDLDSRKNIQTNTFSHSSLNEAAIVQEHEFSAQMGNDSGKGMEQSERGGKIEAIENTDTKEENSCLIANDMFSEGGNEEARSGVIEDSKRTEPGIEGSNNEIRLAKDCGVVEGKEGDATEADEINSVGLLENSIGSLDEVEHDKKNNESSQESQEYVEEIHHLLSASGENEEAKEPSGQPKEAENERENLVDNIPNEEEANQNSKNFQKVEAHGIKEFESPSIQIPLLDSTFTENESQSDSSEVSSQLSVSDGNESDTTIEVDTHIAKQVSMADNDESITFVPHSDENSFTSQAKPTFEGPMESKDYSPPESSHDSSFTDLSVSSFRRSIQEQRELNFQSQRLSEEQLIDLSNELASNGHVKILNLGQCELGPSGVKIITSGLTQNASIAWLNLNRNSIENEGAEALAQVLKSSDCHISKLYLRHNNLGDQGMKILCEALKYNSSISVIDFGDNYIQKGGVTSASELLFGNEHIEEFGISGNDVETDQDWIPLFQGLKENKKLKKLFLAFNTIGDVSVSELANQLGPEGLQFLDMEGNQISDGGGKEILSALEKGSCCLKELLLEDNNISDNLLQKIRNALFRR